MGNTEHQVEMALVLEMANRLTRLEKDVQVYRWLLGEIRSIIQADAQDPDWAMASIRDAIDVALNTPEQVIDVSDQPSPPPAIDAKRVIKILAEDYNEYEAAVFVRDLQEDRDKLASDGHFKDLELADLRKQCAELTGKVQHLWNTKEALVRDYQALTKATEDFRAANYSQAEVIKDLQHEVLKLRRLGSVALEFAMQYGREWAEKHKVDDHLCDLDHKDEMTIAEAVLAILDAAEAPIR